MALKYYTEEELAIMFPSSPPLAMMGCIPICKGNSGDCMKYVTVYGTGEISPTETIEVGTFTIDGYYFYIIGKDMSVMWCYKGVTKYKQYQTTEGFLNISGKDLCNNKVELKVDEFVKLWVVENSEKRNYGIYKK